MDGWVNNPRRACTARVTVVALCVCVSTICLLPLLRRHHYVYACVLCCFALFVCLTLLASFFLPSHLSFTCTYFMFWSFGTSRIEKLYILYILFFSVSLLLSCESTHEWVG